jgi:AraC family transcriptional regulator
MTKIISLGKTQYLGDINYIRQIADAVASAVSADPLDASNDALHFHENPIISFILAGDSVERINRETNLRVAGDIRFYRAGDLHQVKIKRFPSRNLNFELETGFLSRNGFSEESIKRAIEKNPSARLLFLRAYRELSENDALTDTSIQILLFSLISESLILSRDKMPGWINILYEILNDRWNEPLGLQELACVAGVHPVTISKYFTRYFRCTFGEYVRRLRIDKSLAMIKNSQLSLTEIALACGFADQSHFTRNFKGLTGFLPKDFKKL